MIYSVARRLKNLSLLSLLLSGCASQGIHFDPDFGVGDYQKVGITREGGRFVSCTDPAFNREFALDQTKVYELAELLHQGNSGKSLRASPVAMIYNELDTDNMRRMVLEGRFSASHWEKLLRDAYWQRRAANEKIGLEPTTFERSLTR